MSTRGIYGLRKNGVDKATYNHSDSYPKGLGQTVVDFCRSTSIQELNEIFDRVEMVNETDKPNKEQLEICRKWEHSNKSAMENNDWYGILRPAQSNMTALKSQRYMTDAYDFIEVGNFCNYAYIINLDKHTLEFWVGYQNSPQAGNRYGTKKIEGSYPCRMALVFPLDDIPKDAVKKMEACRDEDRARPRGSVVPPALYTDNPAHEITTANEDEEDMEI